MNFVSKMTIANVRTNETFMFKFCNKDNILDRKINSDAISSENAVRVTKEDIGRLSKELGCHQVLWS